MIVLQSLYRMNKHIISDQIFPLLFEDRKHVRFFSWNLICMAIRQLISMDKYEQKQIDTVFG